MVNRHLYRHVIPAYTTDGTQLKLFRVIYTSLNHELELCAKSDCCEMLIHVYGAVLAAVSKISCSFNSETIAIITSYCIRNVHQLSHLDIETAILELHLFNIAGFRGY